MSALREAAQQTLEQVEPDLFRCPQCNGPADNGFDRSFPPSPYLCTQCMAEPVQEPVAWMSDSDVGFDRSEFGATPTVPLYTAPPRRKMVPLTEEDLGKLYADWYKTPAAGLAHFARAVEKAIWEKNK